MAVKMSPKKGKRRDEAIVDGKHMSEGIFKYVQRLWY